MWEGGCCFPLPGKSGGSFAEPGSGPRHVLGWRAWELCASHALCPPPQLLCWKPLSPGARVLLKTILIPPSSTDPVRTRKIAVLQEQLH